MPGILVFGHASFKIESRLESDPPHRLLGWPTPSLEGGLVKDCGIFCHEANIPHQGVGDVEDPVSCWGPQVLKCRGPHVLVRTPCPKNVEDPVSCWGPHVLKCWGPRVLFFWLPQVQNLKFDIILIKIQLKIQKFPSLLSADAGNIRRKQLLSPLCNREQLVAMLIGSCL